MRLKRGIFKFKGEEYNIQDGMIDDKTLIDNMCGIRLYDICVGACMNCTMSKKHNNRIPFFVALGLL